MVPGTVVTCMCLYCEVQFSVEKLSRRCISSFGDVVTDRREASVIVGGPTVYA